MPTMDSQRADAAVWAETVSTTGSFRRCRSLAHIPQRGSGGLTNSRVRVRERLGERCDSFLVLTPAEPVRRLRSLLRVPLLGEFLGELPNQLLFVRLSCPRAWLQRQEDTHHPGVSLHEHAPFVPERVPRMVSGAI